LCETKERLILFSAPLVRANWKRSKTPRSDGDRARRSNRRRSEGAGRLCKVEVMSIIATNGDAWSTGFIESESASPALARTAIQ